MTLDVVNYMENVGGEAELCTVFLEASSRVDSGKKKSSNPQRLLWADYRKRLVH